MITVEIHNDQTTHAVDARRIEEAVRGVLRGEGIARATISVAVVDDPTIHELNRRYLQHDYPTDVLSFLLESSDAGLEGEVVVSADTAATAAAGYDWAVADELLLYVVHGVLHLAGHDDHDDVGRQRMRQQERRYLRQWGLKPRYDEEEEPPPATAATARPGGDAP